jgi:anti-sigma B factor antagonist
MHNFTASRKHGGANPDGLKMNADLESFDIIVSRTPHAVTVALAGELDMSTADEVTEALTDALHERPDALYVDLADVGFIDSTGIRAILRGRILANSVGAEFRCLNPQAQARKALDILNLAETLGITD